MALEHLNHVRLRIVATVTAASLTILVGRLVYVQVIDHDWYVKKAEVQHFSHRVIPARRGSITSSDGADLAISVPVQCICADPDMLADTETIMRSVAGKLARATEIPYRRILKELKSDDTSDWHISNISESTAAVVTGMRIPGVTVSREGSNTGGTAELTVHTKVVKDPEEHIHSAAVRLSELLGVSYDEILTSLGRKAHSAWLKRDLTRDDAAAVLALELDGVQVCLVQEEDREVMSVRARPMAVTDPADAAEKLSEVLEKPADELRALLCRRSRFAWIKRRVSDETANAVLALDIPGIITREEHERCYPQGRLLGAVLGYVTADQAGGAGLELAADEDLRGTPGSRTTARSASGKQICHPKLKDVAPIPGKDIVLTIDSNIQKIAEEEVLAAAEKWKPNRAMAVVMAPGTGALLAVANWPSFEPALYSEYTRSRRELLERNAAGVDLYEPGSVFKPFTAALVLEHALANERTVFDCEYGCAVIRGRRLHDVHPYGPMTLKEIIVKSSNIGAAKLALLLGKQRLHDGLAKFGFGSREPLPFPGCPSGRLWPVSRWTSYSISSLSMGHEVTTTTVQLCNGFSTIANNGRRMRTRLIKATIDPVTGEAIDREPDVVDHVISSRTAGRVREILADVVEEGTGKRAALDAYRVGGKTGTAQMVKENGRGYAPSKYNSSFVGMAPVDRPRVCVAVTLRRPRKAHYGGTVAAPACGRIIRRTLAYMQVPPRENETTAMLESTR